MYKGDLMRACTLGRIGRSSTVRRMETNEDYTFHLWHNEYNVCFNFPFFFKNQIRRSPTVKTQEI